MTRVKASKPTPDADSEQLIARAEAAVVALSSQFAGWMEAECERLHAICRRLAADRPTPRMLEQLFSAAHDIKGEAATFGYPIMERIAASLCRLIDETRDRPRIPVGLVARHVVVMREALRIDREADHLAHEIERATMEFLSDNKRAAGCPRVPAPPLAPRLPASAREN